jgi:hypothetical protein
VQSSLYDRDGAARTRDRGCEGKVVLGISNAQSEINGKNHCATGHSHNSLPRSGSSSTTDSRIVHSY